MSSLKNQLVGLGKAIRASLPSTSNSRSNVNAQGPPPTSDNFINILLLGETGVGKSTFINSFVNYISFKEFDIALKNEPHCVIPTKFNFYTEDLEEKKVSIGTDKNEFTDIGVSATQGAKSYVFPLGDGKHNLRIIDTPGIGDTRGIEQDKENFENILDFLGRFENLHSICILMRPNESRLTVMFEFCLKQLLSRLDKSAANNIMFVFTNTRSTFYRPGETKSILEKILGDIERIPPHIKIPFNVENIFCLDNEAYRFLIASKNSIQFHEREKDDFTASWDKSVKECIRLICYIVGSSTQKPLPPHKVQNTLSVNEARRVILMLAKPLADITQLIQDNKQVLLNHKSKIEANKQNLKTLNEQLYLPCVNLRQIELQQPVTVCTSDKCAKTVTVENTKMRDYCQRCHDPCYLTNVPKEIIGTPELIHCAAMSGSNCKLCTCEFTLHMHIYYMTERYEDKIEDKSIKLQVDQGKTNAELYADYTKRSEKLIADLNSEHNTITKSMAKFAHFLKMNTILPFNDSYKAYIEHLIDREEHLGVNQDKNLIKHYRDMLNMYEEEKILLERAMNMPGPSHFGKLNCQNIMDSVQALFSLKEYGSKLKSLYEMQQKGISREHGHNEEYYHSNPDDSSFLAFTSQEKTKKQNVQAHQQSSAQPGVEISKDVFVPRHLMCFAIGAKGEYINAVRAIPGIKSINETNGHFKILGVQEAVKEAANALKIVEKIFNIPLACIGKFLESQGRAFQEIVIESKIILIRVIGETDDTFKGCRKENLVPCVLIGTAEAEKTARNRLLSKVNAWRNDNMPQQRVMYTTLFTKFGRKEQKRERLAMQGNYSTEFTVRKDLLDLVYGENYTQIDSIRDNKNIVSVDVNPQTGNIKITGQTQEAVDEAKSALEYLEAVVRNVPKVFVDSSNKGGIFSKIEKISKVTKMQIKSPLIKFVGTRKQIMKAVAMLQTSLDTSEHSHNETLNVEYLTLANSLEYHRDGNENRGHDRLNENRDYESRECKNNPTKKLIELINIPRHLVEFVRDNLPKARGMAGIEKIELNSNTLAIHAVDRETIQQAKSLLQYREETIKLSRNFMIFLVKNEGKTVRQILDTSKSAYIKVNGDSDDDPLTGKSSNLSISVAGTAAQISKTKLLVEHLQTHGEIENNQADVIFIPSGTFYAKREQSGFGDVRGVSETRSVHENDRGASGIDRSLFQSAGNSFGDARSDFEDAKSNFGDTRSNFGSARSTFRDTGSLFEDARSNFGDDLGDTRSVFGDMKSQFGDTKSQFGDTKSQFGDTRSQFGDTKSQFGDTKSQFGDTKSQFGDTKSQFGDSRSVFGDTGNAFGVNKTAIKDNRDPGYVNRDFGSTKSAFNLSREEFHVPKHLMGAAQGSIGQNLDKARNIPGIKIIVPKEEGFVVEGTSPSAVKEARSILEISEEIVTLPEETVQKFKANGPNAPYEMKSKTGIFSVAEVPPKQPTMAEILISQQISNLLVSYPEERDPLKNQNLPLQTAVLYLPRRFVVRLLEQDQIMLTSLINISGVREIKIFGDDNLRGEATKIAILNATILGSPDKVEKAKFLLDRARMMFEQLPVSNIEYEERAAMSVPVKTGSFYSSRPAEGMVNIRLVGNLGSISRAKTYFEEMTLCKVEFKIPENLVSMARGENDCNLRKAESFGKIEIEGNVFKVQGSSKEGVEKVRAILEVGEVVFEIPQDIVTKVLADKGSTMKQIVEAKGCVLRNVAAKDQMFSLSCGISGNKGNLEEAKAALEVYFDRLRQGETAQSSSEQIGSNFDKFSFGGCSGGTSNPLTSSVSSTPTTSCKVNELINLFDDLASNTNEAASSSGVFTKSPTGQTSASSDLLSELPAFPNLSFNSKNLSVNLLGAESPLQQQTPPVTGAGSIFGHSTFGSNSTFSSNSIFSSDSTFSSNSTLGGDATFGSNSNIFDINTSMYQNLPSMSSNAGDGARGEQIQPRAEQRDSRDSANECPMS